MSLRVKILLVVGSVFIVVLALLYATLRPIVLGGFKRVEEQSVSDRVQQGLSGLSDEISVLSTITADWAMWDDTYAFMENVDPDYIRSNVVLNSFVNNRVNLMLFIDPSGKAVLSRAFDFNQEEEITVPNSIWQHLSPESLLLQNQDENGGTSGLLILQEGPLLVSYHAILTSAGKGPPRGTLVWGRYLDSSQIESLTQKTNLSLTIYSLAEAQLLPELQAVTTSLLQRDKIIVQPLSADSVAGYALLKDIYGKPALILRVDRPRLVYEQGQITTSIFMLSLGVIFLLFMVVLFVLIRAIVVTPIERLSTGVSSVEANGRLPIALPGKDEISRLGDTINDMLDKLRESRIKLQEGEERFRRVFEEAPFGMALISADFKFARVNQAMCRILGYGEEEFAKTTFNDIIYPEDIGTDMQLIQKVFATGEIPAYHTEKRCLTKNGKVIQTSLTISAIHDVTGKLLYGLLMLGDVTEHKRVEEELHESEERYRALVKLGTAVGEAVIMLWDTDDQRGVHAFASDTWAQLTGYSQEELCHTSIFRLIHPGDVPAARERYERRLAGEALPGLFEMTIIRKDGTEVNVEITGGYTTYRGKRVVVAYIRDITERQQMQEKLLLTDRLAAGIAHELNNPLTGVIGLSELLMEKNISTSIREDLEAINNEAQRAAQVVKKLLTFARKHPVSKQPVNVKEVIEEVMALRAYEMRVNNIKVDTRFAPDLPKVLADYFELQQVFLNIIVNAEYFMTEAHHRGMLTITTEKAGNVVRVSFTDDGPGISPRNLPHVFDPFFTTKEVGKGTGLGLTVCHGIITAYGGRIYAQSEPGKGATFIVELPTATAEQ